LKEDNPIMKISHTRKFEFQISSTQTIDVHTLTHYLIIYSTPSSVMNTQPHN
jgi:hypothetical protein